MDDRIHTNTYASGSKVSRPQLTPKQIAQYVNTDNQLMYAPISSECVFSNIFRAFE